MRAFDLDTAQRQIYRRYAELALPRHTSYPIAPVWSAAYGPTQLRDDLRPHQATDRPLSLYVHVPFCEKLCYYCACTKEIIPRAKRELLDPSDALLEGLQLEGQRLAAAAGPRPVEQVHLGGGSPTFLRPAQLERLWAALSGSFDIRPGAEVAIEIDPRITTAEHLSTLRRLGFNRISLGVQDFDPDVQRTVNRIQPFEMVEQTVQRCRALGFDSVNFDLIYGLPFQTPATMTRTLDQVIELAPDRIAFYRLAVIPDIFRWQNVFRGEDLPSGELSLELNLLAINRFLEAGYEFIGLDHFARPDEALSRARAEGTLRRNFQGMTTGQGLDVLGLGPSAISQLDSAFAQSPKTSADWNEAVRRDLATQRGLRLSDDDRLRRDLLQQLYGQGVIVKRSLEEQFGIVFDDYFARERPGLDALRDEGLIEEDAASVRLTSPLGRLLARVAAAVFDRYLPAEAYCRGLSAELASRVG